MDFLVLTLVMLFFLTCWGLLALCEHLLESK